MKSVITTGHATSGLDAVHAVLERAGVAQASPSRNAQLTPHSFLDRLFHAHELDGAGKLPAGPLLPGKVWHELAADLFLSNLSCEVWGWSDARNRWLLDFWQGFDTQCRFVLVYESPHVVLGAALARQAPSPGQVEAILSDWMSSADELLRFYHRHASHCLLVNAAAARREPARIVRAASERFELSRLQADVPMPLAGRPCEIASALARMVLDEEDEVHSVFAELESAADVDGGDPGIAAQDAWAAYRGVIDARDAAECEAAHLRRLTTAMQADIEVSRLQWLQESERFAANDASHRESIDELKLANARLEALHGEAIRSVDALMAKQHESEVAVSEATARLEKQNNQLVQENELLLLQLTQMQEEIDHLAAESARLNRLLQPPVAAPPPLAPKSGEPRQSRACIDLRGDIDGVNWYYAEPDGRWAGPGHTSLLRTPALADGVYRLCIDVVDAKSRDILLGMWIALNGKPLELAFEGEGVVATVTAEVDSRLAGEDPVWTFSLHFPRLISPAEHGSDDHRVLAVRVQSLELQKVR